jgi:hypothetical protein
MRRLSAVVLVALAAAFALTNSATATNANGNHDHYAFLAGVEPVEGPDTAVAPNGSTVQLTGSGDFNAGPGKSASGGGGYVIKDASGSTVASGSWTVTGVGGFVSYGEGIPQGAPGVFGGQLKLKVSLAGAGDGLLTVTCLLGAPPAGADEGITLILGHGWNFTHSTGGETAFVGL